MKDFISFPALGWKFQLSPTLVEFPLFDMQISIKWYGVIIAIGFLLAMIYGMKRAKEFKIDPDRMIDVVLVSALFAFLGARLYFVLFSGELSTYLENPLDIFAVWKGGLAIYGGILFAFLTALWMCRLRKVNALAMFDLASLGFLIGQGIGRWGNFFNQEAFGTNTTLPWGMSGSIIQQGVNGIDYVASEPVHPTFLYESLWCILGFVLLHLLSKKLYKFRGEIFSLYLVWYGAGRFFIEGLRTDSLFMGTIRISQMLAILSVVGGLILFFVFKNYEERLPKDLFATPEGEEQPDTEANEGEEAGEDSAADAETMEEAGTADTTGTTDDEDTPNDTAEAVAEEEAVAEDTGKAITEAVEEAAEEMPEPATNEESDKK